MRKGEVLIADGEAKVSYPNEDRMRNAEDGWSRLETGGNEDREVLMRLSMINAVIESLRIECARVKDTAEVFNCAFTRILRTVVKGNANANVGGACESILPCQSRLILCANP